jgi:hypothetical protein
MIAGVFFMEYQQVRLLERMANAMALTTTPTSPDSGKLVESFKSGGVTYYVVTTKGEEDPNETTLHWERRHLDQIAAAWQEHTPD